MSVFYGEHHVELFWTKAIITGGIYLFWILCSHIVWCSSLKRVSGPVKVEIEVIRIVRHLLTSADIDRFFFLIFIHGREICPSAKVPDVCIPFFYRMGIIFGLFSLCGQWYLRTQIQCLFKIPLNLDMELNLVSRSKTVYIYFYRWRQYWTYFLSLRAAVDAIRVDCQKNLLGDGTLPGAKNPDVFKME